MIWLQILVNIPLTLKEMDNSKIINLTKGKTICLTKSAEPEGEPLKTVKVGLSWGPIELKEHKYIPESNPGFFGKLLGKKPTEGHYEDVVVGHKDVDLDSSVCIYDSSKTLLETVYFGHKNSNDRSIRHLGDDMTGSDHHGEGSDNETIIIDLSKTSATTKHLVIILNSYRHDKFDQLPYAEMRIYNDNKVFADYKIANNPEFYDKEALVLGVFTKSDSGLWSFRAVGTSTNERSVQEIASGSAKRAL